MSSSTVEDIGFIESHTGWFIVLMLLASCVLWCCLAHCIFIPCCTCLKRRHKLNEMCFIQGPDEPMHILSGHRGGSAEGTENTLFAFKHAVDCGLNLMELDVHMTRDGKVVVFHDEDLKRMCGQEF